MDNPLSLLDIANFIIPGFFIYLVLDKTQIHQKRSDYTYILKCLVCSCCYNLLFFGSSLHKILLWALFPGFWYMFFVSIGIPLFIGMFLAICRNTRAVEKLFRKMGLTWISETPTAWDSAFSQMTKKDIVYFITVTLTDNNIIIGHYANGSSVSTEAEERDIFIRKVYIPISESVLKEDKSNQGIYIAKDQIKMIRFDEYIYSGKDKDGSRIYKR